ncbi:hypothetical protein AVEN_199722-1 [Araneus ventricosus]|uniref:Uncharacterized protein n=1 Tax=Araneus ventricosus TaxID=182803 RepID=A0A4Y2RZF5_ARAVE|nr:hypothetical protein AVEN_199722-1 [Araneus ventricosus]
MYITYLLLQINVFGGQVQLNLAEWQPLLSGHPSQRPLFFGSEFLAHSHKVKITSINGHSNPLSGSFSAFTTILLHGLRTDDEDNSKRRKPSPNFYTTPARRDSTRDIFNFP